jgi:diaminohydroxyphosphoribosylaminopyrimidine deaminase/5-amino-6-(5-phosphoribosylamino)uracil reductase
MDKKDYIKRCLYLASKGKGYTSPNPLVGCVIVKEGKILAGGYHHKFGDKHAEIDALDKVKGKAEGATLYVNLEPCCFKGKTGPCTERIIKEKINKVVIGSLDPNEKVAGKGVKALKKAGIEVESGVLEEKCTLLNQFFFKFIKTGLPYVTLKIAQTSDHYIAYPNGSCPHITNLKSRTFVHESRAWYDAVLVGKTTLIKDNPELTIRHVAGRQPLRLILDTHAEMISSSKKILIDNHTKNTIWIVGEDAKFQNPHNIKIIKCKSKGGHVDLKDMLIKLASTNICSILVEGGAQIWQSFLDAGLTDQIQIFTAKQKFGNGIPSVNTDLPFKKAEAINFGSDKLEIKYLNLY